MTTVTGRQAIVLAAGAGRRFGGGKLTAVWAGEALIRASVRQALSCNVDQVIVVVGADAAVANDLIGLAEPRLRLIPAFDWDEGIAASLRAGIAALPQSTLAVVIFLGDMPRIPPRLADQLLNAVIDGAPAAAVVSQRGPAHPVAFSPSIFNQLLRLRGDRGARTVLEALGHAVSYISNDDPGVVLDIDCPTDIEALWET